MPLSRQLRVHTALSRCVERAKLVTPSDHISLQHAMHYALHRRKDDARQECLFWHKGNVDAAMLWFETHAMPTMKTACKLSANNAASHLPVFLLHDCIVIDARNVDCVTPALLMQLFCAAGIQQTAVQIIARNLPETHFPVTCIEWL